MKGVPSAKIFGTYSSFFWICLGLKVNRSSWFFQTATASADKNHNGTARFQICHWLYMAQICHASEVN